MQQEVQKAYSRGVHHDALARHPVEQHMDRRCDLRNREGHPTWKRMIPCSASWTGPRLRVSSVRRR